MRTNRMKREVQTNENVSAGVCLAHLLAMLEKLSKFKSYLCPSCAHLVPCRC